MHARVTYSTTDPTQAPERLRFIKERVAPSASSREGFKAGYWMSDPATGKGLAITFWESEAAMLAIAGMAGEALLFSIAQIAIATTGFAGIVSALVRDKWTQGHALRFNGLITASLSAAMLSLLPSLIVAGVDDERRAVSLASGAGAVYFGVILVVRLRQMARAHLLRSPIAGFAAISLAVLFTASLMNALWWVSLGGFTGLVAFELFTAFVLFYSLLAESAPSRGQ